MILVAFILFLLVVFFSYLVYLVCKKVIYKLNKRVLARNLAMLRNSDALKYFDKLTVEQKRDKLIVPFFRALGYNTFDRREFKKAVKFNDIAADYITKKWNKSKLCKRSFYIKYFDFTEISIDTDKKLFNSVYNIDELMDEKYFDGEYYILTNGYIYLFFSKKHFNSNKKYDFYFNMKSFSKNDISGLARFSKQCMFFQVADIFIS